MKTIRHFERALGRKIVWYPRVLKPKGKANDVRDVRWPREYVQRLRIYPHAIRDANAYYDPDKTSLLFGYFAAADRVAGRKLSRRPRLHVPEPGHRRARDDARDSGLDPSPLPRGHQSRRRRVPRGLCRYRRAAAALHVRRARRAPARRRAAGDRSANTVFGELATQFGEALEGNRGALRSMIGRVEREGPQWVPLEAQSPPTTSTTSRRTTAAPFSSPPSSTPSSGSTGTARATFSESPPAARASCPKGSISLGLVRRLARRSRRDRRAPAPHLYSRPRLLPAERHLVRQLPAGAHHGRSRHRAGRRERLPRRAHRSVPRARHLPAGRQHAVDRKPVLESSGLHGEAAGHRPLHRQAPQAAPSRRWSKPPTGRSCTSDPGRRRRS